MGQLSVTAVDVVVTAVVLISAVFAMWRGLVSETFAIFEWVAGGYVALRFTPTFQPLLRGVIASPWLEYAVAFVGTFLLVFIPLSIAAHRLSDMVKRSDVGAVDRTLGFVFGVGRGLVIVGLAYIAYAALVPAQDRSPALTNAQLFPVIENTSQVLLSIIPGRSDELDLIRPSPPAGNNAETQAAKTYGAGERSALDRLIETTGAGQDRTQ